MTTPTRSCLGVAKDLYRRSGLEVDLGAYVTQDYTELFRARLRPGLGLGLHVGF